MASSKTIKYFRKNLEFLPDAYAGSDTNRMTIGYFGLSALDLLQHELSPVQKQQFVEWIYAQQIVPGGDCLANLMQMDAVGPLAFAGALVWAHLSTRSHHKR